MINLVPTKFFLMWPISYNYKIPKYKCMTRESCMIFFPPHLSWVSFINIPSVSTEAQKSNIISADLFEVTLGGHTPQELKISGIRQETQCTLYIPDNIRNIISMHHVLRKTFINKSLSEFRGQFVPNSTQRRNHSSTSLINF